MAQLKFYERKSRAYKMTRNFHSKGIPLPIICHEAMLRYGIGKKMIESWIEDFDALGEVVEDVKGDNVNKPGKVDKGRAKESGNKRK